MNKQILSDLDYEIIKILNKNARVSSNAIATQLNVTQKTIKTHIDNLIENKIILPVAVVNPDFFGYRNIVDIFVWTTNDDFESIHKYCKEHTEVTYFSIHWENEAISIQTRFKSFNDLTHFIDDLKTINNIQKVEYNIVPEILYDSFSWVPKKEDFNK